MALVKRASKRREAEAFAALDSVVVGTSWGMAIASEPRGTHRNARKWERIRRKHTKTEHSHALSGAALDRAVMALAVSNPDIVAVRTA